MNIKAVASSRRSEAVARETRIALIEPRGGMKLDLVVDGADEITPELDLLKGRGGALLREKVLAQAAQYFLVIADSSKRVARLGTSPVPVEVVPFAVSWVADRIVAIGGEPTLRRERSGEPYRTDQQNFILDCHFVSFGDPVRRAEELAQIAGIVEHGLFLGCAHAALIGEGNEVIVLQPGRTPVPLADFALPR
jgi:ribose 5-phosphate isomerase A